MYSKNLLDKIIEALAPNGYLTREQSEQAFPARTDLPDGAEVMRVPPSPTGGDAKCMMGSATPKNSSPMPMPAENSMANQEP